LLKVPGKNGAHHTYVNRVVIATVVTLLKFLMWLYYPDVVHAQLNGRVNIQMTVVRYSGACDGMEVADVKKLFQHSLPRHNVRYAIFLGTGDTKAHSAADQM
jgi:hypothetical protein